ncbi:hypothetical protein CEXT_2911 [Caerostris extrusa]|uniref:Uncharacterized protein n=1 Tax=Caerostris extrusa TaxID=172846 RepID=A0AAV4VHV7_CAEEX|nr:hypothetical protein CEXT_2911 [Caerostris extrusa]
MNGLEIIKNPAERPEASIRVIDTCTIKRSYRTRPLLYSQSSRKQRYKKAGNTLSGSHKNVFRPHVLKEVQKSICLPLAASVYVEQTRKVNISNVLIQTIKIKLCYKTTDPEASYPRYRYQPIKRSYRIRPLLYSQSSRKQRYKKAGNTLSGSHKNVSRPHVLKEGPKSIRLSSGSKCLYGTDQKR